MRYKDMLEREVAIFELHGKIMIPDDRTPVIGRVHEYLALNKRNILLDCANIEWSGSEGLRMLTVLREAVAEKNGRLALCNVVGKFQSLIDETRVVTLYEIFEDRKSALEAMGQGN